MGIQDFGTMDPQASLKQVIEELANLMDTLNFLLNGNLDVKNIRASSITADRLKVAELSAISANLGHITAGIIDAITINSATINITDDVTIGNNLAVGFGANDRKIILGSAIISYIAGVLSLGGPIDVALSALGSVSLTSTIGNISLSSLSGTITDAVAEINNKVNHGNTGSTANPDSHNHGLTSSDYIQCYNSSGVATTKKQWVPYAGSASHSHTI